MPALVSLIGQANSGKTTLLEKLIPALAARGIKVGTIKHHAHTFAMDTPGKDTWRHKQAGAAIVALSSPNGLGVIRDTDHDLPLPELVSRYFGEVDLVITEGYKHGPAPKIEVCRAATGTPPLPNRDPSWLAMIADFPLEGTLPLFGLDDAPGVATFLIDTFKLKGEGASHLAPDGQIFLTEKK